MIVGIKICNNAGASIINFILILSKDIIPRYSYERIVQDLSFSQQLSICSLYICTSSDSVEIDPDILNATSEDAICEDRQPGDMLEVDLHPKRCT